jgi:beta-lactamase class D
MASDNNQEWTQDDCVNFESAREILSGLIGFRTKWIRAERDKIQPKTTDIAKWKKEKATFIEERRSLNVLQQENVSRIQRVYGTELKRLMEYSDA